MKLQQLKKMPAIIYGDSHYKGVLITAYSLLYLIISCSEGSYDIKARLQISLVRNFVKTLKQN